jgi:hypothetical protein
MGYKADRVYINGKPAKEISCPLWCEYDDSEVNLDPEKGKLNINSIPRCPVNGVECRYGLTDVNVPKGCPLKEGVTLTLKSEKLPEQ